MAELLLELFSEEIPARMQARAADDLQRLVGEGLKAAGIAFDRADAFVTPRRLVLVVDGIPERQDDVSEERRGPRTDAPEKAKEGFKASLPEGAVIEERELPKGTFFFAVIEKKGGATIDALPAILQDACAKLPWPKSMRWADHKTRWVRPLHSVICLFGGDIVPLEVGPVTAGNQTRGHRFLSPDPITVTDFSSYMTQLMDAKVLVDQVERRATIKAQAEQLAGDLGLRVKDDDALLDEVTGLVEWPVAVVGTIDPDFMDLPPEVMVSTMRGNQKYFACEKPNGTFADKFIVIANTETKDGGKAVAAGNERVLRARLSDAKFFWDTDKKTSLASRTPKLKDIVFHKQLGTLDAKVDRMQALAVELAKNIDGADTDRVRSAARLCKADLVTGMVFEFPEVQGIMGRYYALHDGEHADVADAIAEHYSPLGPGDACPTKPTSVAVALADKLDTLTGFWMIDEKPTGSKDPYALRRAALGVIRLITENGLRLPLKDAFAKGLAQHGSADVALADDLMNFFADRLKVHLKGQGVRHDLITAVFALGGEDDLVRLLARVEALDGFLKTDDGLNLVTAYKRAANILKIEEKKDGKAYSGAADAAKFDLAEEGALADAINQAKPQIEAALEAEKFAEAMTALAALRAPVDAFFDKVTVNADDAALRENRLRLLSEIRGALEGVADFSVVEG